VQCAVEAVYEVVGVLRVVAGLGKVVLDESRNTLDFGLIPPHGAHSTIQHGRSFAHHHIFNVVAESYVLEGQAEGDDARSLKQADASK
jgi:hypothetical protein